jgi:hypothetical protein
MPNDLNLDVEAQALLNLHTYAAQLHAAGKLERRDAFGNAEPPTFHDVEHCIHTLVRLLGRFDMHATHLDEHAEHVVPGGTPTVHSRMIRDSLNYRLKVQS